MLNKLTAFLRQYHMVEPGDHVICAVSGGADSVALLFAMYLLRQKLEIQLSAAHFNHHLRGEESDRDETFVRTLCDRYDIPLFVGGCQVVAGEKGLEAAAREARYAYFRTLPGKIATAHTADDNAETVLLHLIRGTALKGLGGIAPVGPDLIRPMLTVTRQEVEAFLEEYCLSFICDSSNDTDAFLRNRIRHHVMPLLKAENPRLAQSICAMALGLQQDAAALDKLARQQYTLEISALQKMDPAIRGRVLERFLKQAGVPEPERSHILLVESLIFSEKPSAKANLPGGIVIRRRYDRLCLPETEQTLSPVQVAIPGTTLLPELALQLVCQPEGEGFRFDPVGQVVLRSRLPGDEMRLPGGTKSLKKIFIDRKIPADRRASTPVLADDLGVLAVYGIGPNLDRISGKSQGLCFQFEKLYSEGDTQI